MSSSSTTNNDGAPCHLLKLPLEIQHCIFRFVMPYRIRPCKSPSEIVFEDKDEQEPLIALFLINKHIYEQISYVLYRHSHFLISVNPFIATCAALESPIRWELVQTERMSVKMASRIRHVDIDLGWVRQRKLLSVTVLNMHLVPLLEYICEHLRAFPCLQTLTVRWTKDRVFKVRPRFELANFILGPLEQLQADLPRLRITIQATHQQSNNETEGNRSDSDIYLKLHDYMSELRETGSNSTW